jgi:hypothetical protein
MPIKYAADLAEKISSFKSLPSNDFFTIEIKDNIALAVNKNIEPDIRIIKLLLSASVDGNFFRNMIITKQMFIKVILVTNFALSIVMALLVPPLDSDDSDITYLK